ncbi:translocation/assembly module TamB domain-containing protein [Gemmatimonas sp.]|uniref:translocation/assembly module TamB domain-containing protein n=1 Tax=Gemmatimonas sp. TaxID=1962908 RepID=UPI00286DB892|nr:translocation/assembly module TamB domain-containing protein [Gemmatimonas sp.]
MGTPLRRVAIGAAAIVLAIVSLAVGAAFVFTNTDWGREQVRVRALTALNGAAHGIVKVGAVSGNLLTGLTLHDLSITDSAGSPFIVAGELHADYGLRALISRRIALRNVRLVDAHIVIERPTGGVWNYDRIFPTDSETPTDSAPGFGDWIVLNDVTVQRSRLTVRIPWTPDDGLRGAARDSAIAVALAGKERAVVARATTGGGWQATQDFLDINGRLPLVRIAHPEFTTRLIRTDSLSMRALPFAPPGADVRQLSGAFELNTDSVWFQNVTLTLPASRAQLSGRYVIENGDLSLRTIGAPIALSDIRFLYPALPDSGEGRIDLSLDWTGDVQRYKARDLDLSALGGRVRGTLGITVGDTLRFADTALEFVTLPTSLIERLSPALDLPRSGTISGRASLDGTATAMTVDGDIIFDDERSGRSRVYAFGELGAANGVFSARNLRVTLAPLQVDLARIAMSTLPVGGTLTGSTTLNGQTDRRLDARSIVLTHLDRGERSRVVGKAAFRMASTSSPTWLDAQLTARPLSLVTVGRFAPAAGLRGAVAGPLRAIGPLSALVINTTLRTSDGGGVSASGQLDLASAELGYSLNVATQLFNANELLEQAPRTSFSAEMQARGRGVDPATMRGEFAVDAVASRVDTVALDSLRLRLRISSGLATLDTLTLNAPGVAADATGTFGLSRTSTGDLRYAARVDSLARLSRYFPRDTTEVFPRPLSTAERLRRARMDSSRVAMQLAVARAAGVERPASPVVIDSLPNQRRDTLAGSLSASGRVTGGLNGFDLTGMLEGLGIVAMGSRVQRLQSEYTWQGALTDSAHIRLRANADTVVAAGFSLDSVVVRGDYQAPGGNAQVAVFQSSDRDYTLNALYAIRPDQREITFNDLRLRFDTTRWSAAAPGTIRWGQPGIEIDSLDLRSNTNGRVFANGIVPTDGIADLRLIVQNFQVGDLLGLVQSDLEANGVIGIDTRITGSGRSPRIVGTASIARGTYRGTPVPDLRSSYDYADRVAQIDAQLTDSVRGDLRPLATATARLPLDLAFSGVEGTRMLEGAATGELRADSLPLDLLSRVTDAVANVRGDVNGQAQLRGTLREPDFTGALALRNGRTDVVALGITLDRMQGSLRLDGDSVVIDSLTADSHGRIAVSGGIGVKDVASPSFDLRMRAERARILDNEQGRASADADVTMHGPFNDVFVQGRARIREGVFYIPKPDNSEVINAGDPAVFAVIDTNDVRQRDLVLAPSPLLANMRMDLGLTVDRDTWVRSQEANIEIYSEDDLRITVDRRRQALALDGIVNTDRGEYEFLSKRFQVKRGAVQFIGTQDINPLLQITAEYQVQQPSQQAIDIRVLIGGTLLSPRLSLESDAQPPISQSDLLSYLAFGSESGSLLQFGGSSLSGGSSGGGLVGTSAALATRQLTGVALGTIVGELEGQAARSLGADVFNITPSNIPTELASGNFGALTTFLKGTQLEFGKYLTTRTFVGLQLQATTTPGFRVQHQLSRNPGLSVESTFQPRFFLPEPSLSTQEITKANAFGLFLVRRWRF